MSETVTIAGLGHSGDGVAESDGARVFVPYTLPGETVEIERTGERGSVVKRLTDSPDRVQPICRHFGTCGGCALQHMKREAYLDWKREQVVAAFRQRGIETPVAPVVALNPGTRRRAVFSAGAGRDGFAFGFHKRGSREIVAIEECPILVPALETKLAALAGMARACGDAGKDIRIVAVAADNGLDIAVTAGVKTRRDRLESLGRFGADPDMARLVLDGTEIFRNRRPEVKAGAASLLPVPGGFLQAARPAEAAMAEAVVARVGKAAPVADLFAGIGTFTVRLAERANVTAVESEEALLKALDDAARRGRGLKPVTTQRRDLLQNPLVARELDRFGAVVFDPPAAGAKAQAEALAASKVKTVVAVSCNPATLARDARILIDGGYRLISVTPVDQFLFSAEIEAVAAFSR